MSGRVPPSSRAGSRVRAMSRARDVNQAARLYERFAGMDAEEIGRVRIPPMPKVAVCVGELDGVLYTTVRDGVIEKYIHKFKASDRPLMCVSPDGRQILILGGRYRFTERGIVDTSDKSR